MNAHPTRSRPRNRVFSWPATVLIQPNASSIRLRMRWHGRLGAGVLEQLSGSIEEAETALRDRYLGQFSSLADYMEELTTGCVTIPEPLRNYIDWEAMARDAELNGDVFTIETAFDEVHVVSSR